MQELDERFEESKNEIQSIKRDVIGFEKFISFEESPNKSMAWTAGTVENVNSYRLGKLSTEALGDVKFSKDRNVSIKSLSSLELAKQLRAIQADHKYQATENERLERQLKVVSDSKEEAEEKLQEEIKSLHHNLREQIAKAITFEAKKNELSEKVQGYEEASKQKTKKLMKAERELKRSSLMKQKLISYLRKLHLDLKLEKNKNESLTNQVMLQMKIPEGSSGSIEESTSKMLPKKIGTSSEEGYAFRRKNDEKLDTKQRKSSQEKQMGRLNDKIGITVGSHESPRRMTNETAQSKPRLLESSPNRLKTSKGENSISSMQNNGTVSGELGMLLQRRRKAICNEVQEQDMNSTGIANNGNQKQIGRLNKHTMVANKINNILQGKGPGDQTELHLASKDRVQELCPSKSNKLKQNKTLTENLNKMFQRRNLKDVPIATQLETNDASGDKVPFKPNKLKQNDLLAANLNNLLRRRTLQNGNNLKKPEPTNLSEDEARKSYQPKPNKLKQNKVLAENLNNIFRTRMPQVGPSPKQLEQTSILGNNLRESRPSISNKLKKNKSLTENLNSILQRRIPQDRTSTVQLESKNASDNIIQESHPLKPNKLKQNKNLNENLSNLLQRRLPQDRSTTAQLDRTSLSNNRRQGSHPCKSNKLEQNKILSENLSNMLQRRASRVITSTVQQERTHASGNKIQKMCPSKPIKLEKVIASDSQRRIYNSIGDSQVKKVGQTQDISEMERITTIDQNLDIVASESLKLAQINDNINEPVAERLKKNVKNLVADPSCPTPKAQTTLNLLNDSLVTYDACRDLEADVECELEKIIEEVQSMTDFGDAKSKSICNTMESTSSIEVVQSIQLKKIDYSKNNSKEIQGSTKNFQEVEKKSFCSLNDEVYNVYGNLREQMSKAAAFEATCEALQADIEHQKKTILENEENHNSLSVNYNRAVEDHDRLYQKVRDCELQLAVQKENAQNLEEQILSREKESTLQKAHFNSRFELQEERIIYMKQQLSLLYTTFHTVHEVCNEQQKMHSELNPISAETDSRVTRQLESELESNTTTTSPSRTTENTTNSCGVVESSDNTNRLISREAAVSITSSRKTSKREKQETSTPLSLNPLNGIIFIDSTGVVRRTSSKKEDPQAAAPLSLTHSRNINLSAVEPSTQSPLMEGFLYKFDKNIFKGWKKRYFTLKENNGTCQLVYSTAPSEHIKGTIQLSMGVSAVTETREFATQQPHNFELTLNTVPQNNTGTIVYLATDSQQDFDQWKAAFDIITKNEPAQKQQEEFAFDIITKNEPAQKQQEESDFEFAMRLQMQMGIETIA